MGGKNHQPCNRILTGISAWLSQRIGDGFVQVIVANNHLENAIILGMNRLHIEDLTPDIEGSVERHVDLAIDSLRSSLATVKQIQVGFDRLVRVANEVGYKGSPFASELDSYALDRAFEGTLLQPTINRAMWDEVHSQIKKSNILKTLEWESEQFVALIGPTEQLIAVLEESRAIAKRSGGDAFVNAIENNAIPLRQYYAQVFSRWNNLDAMFLYSALIMTELFYRLNGYPSLVEFSPELNQQTRAA